MLKTEARLHVSSLLALVSAGRICPTAASRRLRPRISLWDTSTGSETAPLAGCRDPVMAAVAADGRPPSASGSVIVLSETRAPEPKPRGSKAMAQ